ncbi:MAG TPA: helix-turn-helix transcriptional regulator [Kofleriaceae bacterium]|nr:helix-turn-helix transcriptional regulator [Kofleriaceae bacterium]
MEPRSKAPGDPRESARPAARRSQQHPAPPASSRPQPKHGWSRDRFCEYLRAQRERASLSIEDIARVTKIPERSLRQLEEGKFEELPADVFVRGFLRSYARVVGVNGDDVVRRYAMCGLDPAPVASELAQAAAEQLAALAEKDPSAGEVTVAKVEAPAVEPETSDTPVVTASPVRIDSGVDEVRTASAPVRHHGPNQKKKRRKGGHQPKSARRTGQAPAAAARDAEPEPAPSPSPAATRERARRERAFLPPAWSEEETGRRGPLTLAVIILVIIATLTMSYLLRRPAHQGDGVTRRPGASERAA